MRLVLAGPKSSLEHDLAVLLAGAMTKTLALIAFAALARL